MMKFTSQLSLLQAVATRFPCGYHFLSPAVLKHLLFTLYSL